MVLTLRQYFKEKTVGSYLVKFGLSFSLLYFIVLVFKALANPIGYYSPFFDQYIDPVEWFQDFLMISTQGFVKLCGFNSHKVGNDLVRLSSGEGIRLMFGCLGFKVMCAWAAFIIANHSTIKRKMKWILSGCALITIINILRMGMILIAMKGRWQKTFNLDHHDWFNIFSWGIVLFLIFIYDRIENKKQHSIRSTSNEALVY